MVYTPYLASYGSCTATLQYSPGTIVEVYVTYLTPEQMERMIETEGGYFVVRLKNVDLKIGLSVDEEKFDRFMKPFECGYLRNGVRSVESLNSVVSFNHQTGCLTLPNGDSDSNRKSKNR